MVKVKNAAEIQRMIKEHPLEQRRIFSIVAHIDHGKSTACDYLMGRAGLMSAEYEGEKRLTDYDEEEQERGITIFTSVVLLNYDYEGKTYLLEINDTPGHISFTGEVSRALRGSDGAVILVDALEGIMTQTITNIGLSVGNEWCRPVLFINKVDRLIRELKLPPEEITKKFEAIIAEVNSHIEEVSPEPFKGKWTVDPAKGHVIFGSAKDGWAFTIPMLQKKNLNAKIVMDKYRESIEKNDKEPIRWLKENLPLDEALLEVIINHLPSPIEAQKYRMIKIWSGDLKKALSVKDAKDASEFKDDIEKWLGWALINIRKDGPLLGMITKLFIHPKTKRTTLIGRIWSGSLRTGDSIYLKNAKKSIRIRRLGVQEIDSILPVDEIPAGNLFAMELPEIHPAGETFVSEKMKDDELPGFEEIVYASDAVVSQSIKPEKPEDLAKLGDVVSKWVLADPTATFRKDQESGEYILSGIDPLQLEIITERIQDEIPIKISTPITVYYETPLDRSIEIRTKCSEGHNKLKLYIEPLNKETLAIIREGKITEYQDIKERAKILREEAGWDKKEARRIWTISGTNILVNGSTGVQRLDRIKSYIVSTFEDFCFKANLANEPGFGIRAVVTDATVHEDPTHTRFGQIFVMTVSALGIAFLTANPALFEPILRIDIKVPVDYMGQIMTILTQHRGKVVDTKQVAKTAEIQAELPASEAVAVKKGLGIADEIRSATQGRAIFGYQFERFQMLPKNMQYEKILEIRKRKKEEGKELSEDIPTPMTFKGRMYPEWQTWIPNIKQFLRDRQKDLILKEILDKMEKKD
ncbi:MAG: elongation factor EF-2 [Candidatus Helarchaeota archaeon]|nr:elongation factor EF-2 [Candidatus Helarchaeota archaeon]